MDKLSALERFEGSLLGGALGDALGYTVEFMNMDSIIKKYGENGITEPEIDPVSGRAIFSDDTQMSLFTADGMMRAHVRMMERGIGSYPASGLHNAYKEWFYTQEGRFPSKYDNYEYDDSEDFAKQDIIFKFDPNEIPNFYKRIDNLLKYPELYKSRAPGMSCISAIATGEYGTMNAPINNSKGCGTVMRAAPVGLFLYKDPEFAFRVGCDMGAMTHGHPTGYLASGALSALIAWIVLGESIENASNKALELLKKENFSGECIAAINAALAEAQKNPDGSGLSNLGGGWVAEEALAIGIYCALCKKDDFAGALRLSVNHSGDSDSTGAVCGNILGAYLGSAAIPEEWKEKIELKELFIGMAAELLDCLNREF
ncbi:MAG: ADP-ribosylglycohydrolase family protein [Firmicutes bacterium]|nr:ADP-ribosylglycohydrolase family protein [Bacillota bacterium]